MAAARDGMEERLDAFLQEHPDGVTDKDLRTHFGADFDAVLVALNKMAQNSRVRMAEGGPAGSMFFPVAALTAAEASLKEEERLVLQTVRMAQGRGIWKKSLKSQTKIPDKMLDKILGRLTQRNLIKPFKSRQNKTQKMYIDFNLEPAKDLTGGTFYSDQSLDYALVDAIRSYVLTNLRSGPRTRAQLTEGVASSGLTVVAVSEEDMQQIIDTLLYDGRIEVSPESGILRPMGGAGGGAGGGGGGGVGGMSVGGPTALTSSSPTSMTRATPSPASSMRGGARSASTGRSGARSARDDSSDEDDEDDDERDVIGGLSSDETAAMRVRELELQTRKYRLAKPVSTLDFFSATPCGTCPVFEDCYPGGVVSPESCIYISKWLEF